MTCSHCEALQEEVAYLRSELGLRVDLDHQARLRQALSLRPQTARLILILHAARGRTVPRAQLEEALPGAEDRGSNYLSVYVSFARKALGRDSIETVWGQGFRLSPATLAQLSLLLKDSPNG